ncbi:hypothetical protein J6590_033648 [Homalodisca vitripennis]|nr:hypothetical protein J6590_033648 [Homalodisca vitripennis]
MLHSSCQLNLHSPSNEHSFTLDICMEAHGKLCRKVTRRRDLWCESTESGIIEVTRTLNELRANSWNFESRFLALQRLVSTKT